MKAFTLSYFVRKSKSGIQVKLYARISTNGKRIDFSLGRKIDPAHWDNTSAQLRGRSPEIRELERYLDTVQETFYRIERELMEKRIPVTGENLLQAYNDSIKGIKETNKTLIELFELHNKQIAELHLKGQVVKPTVTRYTTTKNYVIEFLKDNFNKTDISLDDLSYSFVLEFDHFVRVKKNCAHNTTIKYIKNLRKVVNMAVDYGWLPNDPFGRYKAKAKTVARECLSMEEISTIEALEFEMPRLDKVRKWFLFSCYTGLAYIDMMTLTPANLRTDNNGEKWIVKERTKTKQMSRISLLPKAEDIINEFKDDPSVLRKGTIFPALSNQRLNAYLKEIADLAGIKKKLTFHIARHTFATTVTLGNGVSLEALSAQMGHANTRQTQHYAKMVDSRIKREMNAIKDKFTKS